MVYIGDGERNDYNSDVSLRPYDVDVTKAECVGHM